jgi:hypothetical protein
MVSLSNFNVWSLTSKYYCQNMGVVEGGEGMKFDSRQLAGKRPSADHSQSQQISANPFSTHSFLFFGFEE